ncbi:jg23141 [Pararge aegeria aegeria]|uniref:Jg23141 protein n=1 Tax=Pararge aegeria aegeria TaxID=348720 RepID=A0A8S4SCD3_9NEOP|nr:jg23141 [Pararge aegeria aegeria]
MRALKPINGMTAILPNSIFLLLISEAVCKPTLEYKASLQAMPPGVSIMPINEVLSSNKGNGKPLHYVPKREMVDRDSMVILSDDPAETVYQREVEISPGPRSSVMKERP